MMLIDHGSKWIHAGLVLGVLAASSGLASAQAAPAQMPNMPNMAAALGLVSGTVTKATGGAPAAGAIVTARNTATGIQFSASTGDDGRFALPSLAAGTYDIAVQLGGYQVFRRAGVVVAANSAQQINAALEAGDANTERIALLDRIKLLEQRLGDLESSTVLSEPETRVKRVEVYVDANGNEHDEPVPGAQDGSHLPARARLPPADDQREDRGGAGGRGRATASGVGVDAADRRRSSRRRTKGDDRWPTTTRTRSPRPTCSSRPGSRSTRSSSPTSSA